MESLNGVLWFCGSVTMSKNVSTQMRSNRYIDQGIYLVLMMQIEIIYICLIAKCNLCIRCKYIACFLH